MEITVSNIIKATGTTSAEDAAGKIGCSRQALYNWEKLRHIPEMTNKGPNIQNWHDNLAKLGLRPNLEAL